MTPARRQRVGGSPDPGNERRYPRSARVNEVLREVLAEEIERLADVDTRLGLLTVTAIQTDPDLRRATVLFATLGDDAAEALGEARVRLQAAVGRQVRMKRTPRLVFGADPAVAAGQRVEDILSDIHRQQRGGS